MVNSNEKNIKECINNPEGIVDFEGDLVFSLDMIRNLKRENKKLKEHIEEMCKKFEDELNSLKKRVEKNLMLKFSLDNLISNRKIELEKNKRIVEVTKSALDAKTCEHHKLEKEFFALRKDLENVQK